VAWSYQAHPESNIRMTAEEAIDQLVQEIRPPKGNVTTLRERKPQTNTDTNWIIIDGRQHIPTGCFAGEDGEAQEQLAAYIAEKYAPVRRLKDIEDIDIADVLSIYYEDPTRRSG